jgi:CHAD domain-containing protein
MYPPGARRALARRLDALSRNLPPALAGDVEGVHRARVASRRVREILAILAPPRGERGRNAWRKTRARVRRVTRALGGVRELDVALALLDELVAAHPRLTAAILATRAVVAEERRIRDAQMQDALGTFDLARLDRRITDLVTVPRDGRNRRSAFGLPERIADNAAQLEAATTSAGALFALDRLHQVRIAAKKLRYTLELTEELLGVGTRRAVGRLRSMQDLLGRMHDLAVLADHGRRAAAPASDTIDVRGLVAEIDGEIHALHAGYLSRAGVLSSVVEEARSRLLTRVHARAARRPTPAVTS